MSLGSALDAVRTLAGSSRVTDNEAESLDFLLHAIESWKQEEQDWIEKRKQIELLAELWLRQPAWLARVLGADLKQVLDG